MEPWQRANASHFGSRLSKALVYVESIHRMQRRKGTTVPYIGHLLGVASIVIDHGGTEDEAIAALLHDAAEDQGGELRLADIFAEFGEEVSGIVAGCSDSLEADPAKKLDWGTRKAAYLEHLAKEPNTSIVFVSAADKAHNLRSMLADYRIVGEDLWSRFTAKKTGSIRYYRSLLAIYEQPRRDARIAAIAAGIRDTLLLLERASDVANDPELRDGAGLIAL